MTMRHFLAILIVVIAGVSSVASAEDGASPAPLVGVGMHNAQKARADYQPSIDLPILRDIGATSWRDDVFEMRPNSSLEYPLGERMPRVKEMIDFGLGTPVLVLFERPPGGSVASLRDEARLPAFGAFAQSVVKAVGDRPVIYEIGNEWNMRWRTRRGFGIASIVTTNEDYSPENYALWAQSATRAIKDTGSKAPVVVGAIGDDENWEWTRRALKAGMATDADGVSVHLYNHCAAPRDRTAENLLTRLNDFHRLVLDTTGRKDLRIYVTEYGWPSPKMACNVPPDRAAANIAQFILATRTFDWIGGTWFYEFRDRGLDPAELEDNFGLLDRDGKPKPGVCAFRAATALAGELTDIELTSPTPTTRWLAGRGEDGSPVWIVWSTGDDAPTATFDVPTGSRTERICTPTESAGADPDTTIRMLPLIVHPPRDADMRADRVFAKP